MARAKKDDFAHDADGEEEALLLKLLGPASSRGTDAQSQSQMNVFEGEPSHAQVTVKAEEAAEGSETEDENEDEAAMVVDKKKPGTPSPEASSPSSRLPLPTPARSMSPDTAGLVPGRIIGNAQPLKDFKKNIAQGDLVTKAVADLAAVIAEVVMKPFATRRADEMLDCMVVLRKTCLEVGLVLFFGGEDLCAH